MGSLAAPESSLGPYFSIISALSSLLPPSYHSATASSTSTTPPLSPWTSIRLGYPGKTEVVAWITPMAPDENRSTATRVSSTSMPVWARQSE